MGTMQKDLARGHDSEIQGLLFDMITAAEIADKVEAFLRVRVDGANALHANERHDLKKTTAKQRKFGRYRIPHNQVCLLYTSPTLPVLPKY